MRLLHFLALKPVIFILLVPFPFEGRELTAQEARKAADAVTQLYLNQNYLNSRAVPVTPQPGTTDGVLVI